MVADQKWACKDAAQTLPDTIPCTVASTRDNFGHIQPNEYHFFFLGHFCRKKMQRPRLCEGMLKPIDVEQMYHICLKPTLGSMGYRQVVAVQ